jgi:hypothetical protein
MKQSSHASDPTWKTDSPPLTGEIGTHHFHRLLAAFMFGDGPQPPRR